MAASFTYFCLQILLIAALFFSSSTLASATTTTDTNSRPFKKIYAFGDSFTDTGNTRSVSGPTPSGYGHVSNPPYGSTFFHHPSNRYSDGRLMIDFVAETLSLPFLPPYLNLKGSPTNGVNFAVAGSTAINHAFFEKNNLTLDITPQSIQTQIIWFNEYLEKQGCNGSVSSSPECRAAFGEALIWVGEIGANDYVYTIGSSVSSDTIRKLAISSVTAFLQALLSKGVKYVVVQGLPPTGCLTLAMTLAPEYDRDDIGCVKSVNNQTSTHNDVYQATLGDLRRQFPNATIAYLDYWNAYRTVMKNPAAYGFKEPFKACCGSSDPPYNFSVFATCGTTSASACPNPAQYINWDGVHLTEAMYKVLTGMFLYGTYSRPPFEYLLSRKQHEG
ncbi:Esterase precursor, putative [Ricinus communis]|uniref:Esterase, putative n=1 Tax=Ricinus communis TaxID=3988 RepID=B9RAN5_RICCO|nr:Esterase precursor, putative [Ricinus communis]|eukprot:XP_002511260.1 GDSL esterase/lipase At3g48460 [Ricinus communis]